MQNQAIPSGRSEIQRILRGLVGISVESSENAVVLVGVIWEIIKKHPPDVPTEA